MNTTTSSHMRMLQFWTALIASLALVGPLNAATPRFEARYDATDQGPIIRHGDGPDGCDAHGMREPSIVQQDSKFYLFYDGCAAPGWIACLATSDDLKTWKKHGRVLSLGPAGSDDSATASSPWLRKQGDTWYMYYLISAAASPAPDYVPIGPYLARMATSKSIMGPWIQHRDYVPFRGTYAGDIIWYHGEYMMFVNGGQGIARTKDLSKPWTVDAKRQITLPMENSSIYFEPSNGYYWMFLNHIRLYPYPHTDATYVFWTKNPNKWSDRDHAVVLDGRNSKWSKAITGMATVTKVGNRLAIFYDGNDSTDIGHMGRDIGLAWLDLPLSPEKVKLLALPPSEEDDTSSLKDWIWHPTVGDQAATVRFRGSLDLPAGVKAKRAQLTITADKSYTLWLNGQRVGRGTNWQGLGIYDVTKNLRAGRNTIAAEVVNDGGAGGMIAGLKVWLANGRVITSGSSSDWRCETGTGTDLSWTKPEFQANWLAAKKLGNAGALPWQLGSSELDLLPKALAARAAKVQAGPPSLHLGGGFEKGMQNWKVTGGDRIAYDWDRFSRNLWMGDFYLWLNGPGGVAEQISSVPIQAGTRYTLSAEVGYSLDIRKSNLPWPGGRLVLVSKGADGVKPLASVILPPFTSAEAGRFKKVSLTWKGSSSAKGRLIGARLESNGPQIAWDNVRLVEETVGGRGD